MLRFMMFGAIVLTLASAFALYTIAQDTRRLAADVQAKQKQRDKLISAIAVLKAERAYLARAERIGPAARALGMRPANGNQFVDQAAVMPPARTR